MAARKTGSSGGNTRKLDAGKLREISQLRATVREFRLRLQHDARQRRLDLRLLAEAKRTSNRVTREMNALREQGRKLAKQLRKALGESKREERTRRHAQARVAELRAALKRKTEELRRKSVAAANAAAACAVSATSGHEAVAAASVPESPAPFPIDTSTETADADQSPDRARSPKL